MKRKRKGIVGTVLLLAVIALFFWGSYIYRHPANLPEANQNALSEAETLETEIPDTEIIASTETESAQLVVYFTWSGNWLKWSGMKTGVRQSQICRIPSNSTTKS